ncbi:hypothetical protein OED52_06440 [Rhodococcus sp. Z13]|uniref:Uncharacterized protein n=1 Tax=Rhodococcus sacchari TaxID=2962047 RepID=A0ACD4DJF7_9NOCA|nr:hypothetical protein [Rhodococcus sp. Z13]UYP20177.1 hypothetical protein OED52_06440 [Rhodococcus sp. Z13]
MVDFVRLEPSVVDQVVRICGAMLTELEDARRQAHRLSRTEGFGEFESAKQLAAGYRRKASGTPESAVERVEQFIDALTQLRDAFAAGGEAFLDTNSELARQLGAIDPDNGSHPLPS